ncbi:urea ABC transporter substrate-binding protein [bacterium]|nr:urea ABC transporter substrate-binding protein [bacterium]
MFRKILTVLLVLMVGFAVWWQFLRKKEGSTIKLGVLHSLTGTMAISERSMVDAVNMAVEEINDRGGISGRKIQTIIADGRSDWPTFAREAERLILEEKVSTILGCWTSASRKSVKEIVEKHNHLLIYPLQYEGLEDSPNIIYTGAAPNQQIIPAVKWCLDHLGKKFFLVGSDYVFPRTANAMIRDQLNSLQGQVVGEEYLVLGSKNVDGIVNKIVQAGPDVILNTINGDSNIAFFRALRNAGISSDRIPIMSFSIAEEELRSMNIQDTVGDYATWNYFQSLNNAKNREFVKRFKGRYGDTRVTADPIETAYFSVYLWAQAVEEGESDNVSSIRKRITDQSYKAPGGIVYVDGTTRHTWKPVRIGRIREDGQFDTVWSSEHSVRPIPFPAYRSRVQWENFLDHLYRGWGRKWGK